MSSVPGPSHMRSDEERPSIVDGALAQAPIATSTSRPPRRGDDDSNSEITDDDDDAEIAPPPDETPRDESALFSARYPIVPSPGRLHSTIEYLTSLSLLGIFSFFGTLIRLGLVALGTYDGQSVFPVLWAQILGCFCMGMFTVRKRCIEEIYIPLYVGLTTGLCGSITSFSSWMGDVFTAFARIGKPTHGAFYNFMDGLGISLVTLAASSAAFVLGTQIGPIILHPRGMHFIARWVRLNRYGRFSSASHLETVQRQDQEKAVRGAENGRPSMHRANGGEHNGGIGQNGNAKMTGNNQEAGGGNDPKIAHDKIDSQGIKHTIALEDLESHYPAWLQLQLCLLFVLLWLGSILISVYIPKWRGIVSFSLIFSPVGVWLRFSLSRFNARLPSFPLGTFSANMLGTAILAMLLALQYTSNRTLLQCQIMQGLEDGLCGTLTTVSTFIVELKKLERRHAWRYVLGSWIGGQVLMLVILGSVDFARSGGLNSGKCVIR